MYQKHSRPALHTHLFPPKALRSLSRWLTLLAFSCAFSTQLLLNLRQTASETSPTHNLKKLAPKYSIIYPRTSLSDGWSCAWRDRPNKQPAPLATLVSTSLGTLTQNFRNRPTPIERRRQHDTAGQAWQPIKSEEAQWCVRGQSVANTSKPLFISTGLLFEGNGFVSPVPRKPWSMNRSAQCFVRVALVFLCLSSTHQ